MEHITEHLGKPDMHAMFFRYVLHFYTAYFYGLSAINDSIIYTLQYQRKQLTLI